MHIEPTAAGSSGAGTGDGTVEQACNGHRAGETRCSVADKIREHIEQPLRNLPLRHDHASDDKQGNRKQGEVV